MQPVFGRKAYPGNCLFNSSRSGAYFSVFSQLLVSLLFSQGQLISSKVTDFAVLSLSGRQLCWLSPSAAHGLHILGHPRRLALGHFGSPVSARSVNTMAAHGPPDLGCAASQRRLFSTPHYAVADIWTAQAPSIQPICVPWSQLPCT